MNRFVLVFGLMLAAWSGWSEAAERVLLLDVSGERDQETRAEDELVLERLEKLIAERTGGVLVKPGVRFLEPPDPAWRELELSAQQNLQRGEQLFYALKPGPAVEELNRALSALRSAFPGLKDLSALVRVHLLLGVTYFSTGEKALAAQQFRQALLLDPQLVLDDTRFNPLVVEIFEKMRGQLQLETRGTISVISRPAGASVILDGKNVGLTPVTVPGLAAGEHYLQVSLAGYRTWFAVLKLAPGGELRQEVFLQAGESMKLVRHIKRLEGPSLARAEAEDTKPIMEAMEVRRLALAALRRMGNDTRLELAAAKMPEGQPVMLGIFGVSQKDLELAAGTLAAWMRGDKITPLVTAPLGPDSSSAIPSPPSPPAWYNSWWFWTAAGVLVAGAAATTTFFVLERPSGYRIDVIR